MMAGAISSALCMLILGWAKEIAGIFFRDPEQVSIEES
jgi:Na+-driven multidrug efflux pump